MYECKKCGRKYSREDFYKAHIEKCGVDNSDPPVSEYDAEEASELELRNQIKADIEKRKNEPKREFVKHFGKYRCVKCKKYFFTEKLFQKHICK